MSEVQKLKLGFGGVQVEFEGNLSELKSHLPDIMEIMSSHKSHHVEAATTSSHVSSSPVAVAEPANINKKIESTTNNIAIKLKCNSGTDLAKAAAIHLTYTKSKQKFTRQELTDEMRSSSYFKETYRKNLSRSLESLCKENFLTESQTNVFSIHPSKYQEIEAQVA